MANCEECGLTFASYRLQKRHMNGVHGVKSHQCSKCEYKTATEEYLRRHIRQTHSGITFDSDSVPLNMFQSKALKSTSN
jgi:hypothetical protein